MWQPVRIDIENAFGRFAETFRDGALMDKVLSGLPNKDLNADYVFRGDRVIAELKCLTADPMNTSTMARRIADAFKACGYGRDDLLRCALNQAPIPSDVQKRVHRSIQRNLIDLTSKANKQLRATKRYMDMPDAKGMLLVANDDSHMYSPERTLTILANAEHRLEESHIDVIVYFSPNVYHDRPDSDIAWSIWAPSYTDPSDESLGQFVNDLGRCWSSFVELETGDPMLERQEYPDVYAPESLKAMQSLPVRLFEPRRTGSSV